MAVVLICPKCKSKNITREMTFSGYEHICKNCKFSAEDSRKFDREVTDKKPRHTQESVASFLDYMDSMDEMETLRIVEAYDRAERHKKYATIVIGILSIAIVVVLVMELM